MPLCSLSVLKTLGSESLVSMRGVSCPKRVKSAPGWPLFRVQMTVFRASMFFAVRTPLREHRAAAGGRHKTTSKDVHRRRATGRVQHCSTSNARESKRGPILPTRADCSVGEPFLVFTRRPLPPRCLSESSASPQLRRPQPPIAFGTHNLATHCVQLARRQDPATSCPYFIAFEALDYTDTGATGIQTYRISKFMAVYTGRIHIIQSQKSRLADLYV